MAEEEEQANEAKEEQSRSMFAVLKSTYNKIHIEEGTNDPARAFGVTRRTVRKVFTKETSWNWTGISHANKGVKERGKEQQDRPELQGFFEELQAMPFLL